MTGWSANRPARSNNAYVTLVTNADFALGAKALLHSLRLTGTQADLVVMYTGGVSEEALLPLGGARLIKTDLLPLSDAFNARHSRKAVHDLAPFTKGTKPTFHTPLDNFVKLRLWQLDYENVVFLDADTLVLQNCDRLFTYPEFCAAPNIYESLSDFHRLNSGVFTAKPKAQSFERMIEMLDQEDRFWRRTDQTFLQEFFPDWHGLPITYNMLQYVWMNLPDLWHWPAIHVLHYQYEKPWQARANTHAKAQALRPLIELWEHFEAGGDQLDLNQLPNPS